MQIIFYGHNTKTLKVEINTNYLWKNPQICEIKETT